MAHPKCSREEHVVGFRTRTPVVEHMQTISGRQLSLAEDVG